LRFEDDDGAGFEFVGDGGVVRKQEGCLLLEPSSGASAAQHDGRSAGVAVLCRRFALRRR
jgi:hypothetical protein